MRSSLTRLRTNSDGAALRVVVAILAEGKLDRLSRSRLKRLARILSRSEPHRARSAVGLIAEVLAGIAALKVIATPPHAWGPTMAVAGLALISWLALRRGRR